MKNLTIFFKGMTTDNISQVFHSGHPALDIVGDKINFGYGTPLCAPENILVLGITDEGHLHDPDELPRGYGIRFKGLETGLEYLYWHCLPVFPVNGGDSVPRGQIIAYMGNAGEVYQSGLYVPLEDRTSKPFKGTHLHVQAERGGVKVDLLPMINFNWSPTYSTSDWIGATIKVLAKISKRIK